MTDRIQGWRERAGEQARSAGEVTDRYVRENTWTTIAIAALLGCAVGFLLASQGD